MRQISPLAGLLAAALLALGCADPRAPEPGRSEPAASPAAPEPSASHTPGADESSLDFAHGIGVPLVVTDTDFQQQVLENPRPVMVDVWAAWCGPCLILAPTIDELAEEYQGRVVVAKLDHDANPGVPRQYSVRGIPTLLFFKNGKLVKTLVGVKPKAHIVRVLDSLLES